MTGDHHGRTAGRATLLLTATDGTLGTHTTKTLVARASGSGVDASGNAQSVPPPNTVFTQATMGDLVVSIPAADTYVLPPTTTRPVHPARRFVVAGLVGQHVVLVWAMYLATNRHGGAVL
jgi:hypothetical protein